MKKLIAALVALAVMALAPATALGAQGGTDRPYKVGVSTSTVVTNTSPTEGIVEFAGTVRGTHIGNGTIEGTGTLVATGETTFGYNAAYTITAANGDQLFATDVGTGTVDNGSSAIDITGTITGGTGRFEGASGSYTGAISNVVTAGAPPVTTYDSTASSLGTISY
jgi:hypothetical protein